MKIWREVFRKGKSTENSADTGSTLLWTRWLGEHVCLRKIESRDVICNASIIANCIKLGLPSGCLQGHTKPVSENLDDRVISSPLANHGSHWIMWSWRLKDLTHVATSVICSFFFTLTTAHPSNGSNGTWSVLILYKINRFLRISFTGPRLVLLQLLVSMSLA